MFAGVLEGFDPEKRVASLTEARMCLYWPAANKGVLGLASDGPLEGARVSPPVQAMTLTGVTAVMDASDVARKTWETDPWQ